MKNSPTSAGDVKRHGFHPWVRKSPWRREWQLTPVFLLGESYGQKSLVGYSPWGRKDSDMSEATEHSHTKLIIIIIPVYNIN